MNSRWKCVAMVGLAALVVGCGETDHKPTVQARFSEFARLVCQDNVDGCVRMVDPVYVRAQGEQKVTGQLKLLMGLFKLGKLTEADVRVDQVAIHDDKKSAEVQFSLQNKGAWASQKPSKWVLSEGQWFLQF